MVDSGSPDDFELAARTALSGDLDDVDLDAFSVTFNLFRAYAQLQRRLEAEVYRPAGLSAAGFRILFTLRVLGELEPRQLASRSGVSTAAPSGVVTTLERDALVARAPHPTDGRRQLVRLTAAGADLVVEVYRRQNELEKTLVDGVPEADRGVASAVLRRLTRRG